MKYRFIIFIIFSIIINSCNKDKPSIKKVAGQWHILEYKTNGIDLLSLFDSTCYLRYVNIVDDENGDDIDARIISIADVAGEWTLERNTSKIIINEQKYCHENYYNSFGPFVKDKIIEWNIEKLEEDEMWLETIFENNNYSIKLDNIYKQYD